MSADDTLGSVWPLLFLPLSLFYTYQLRTIFPATASTYVIHAAKAGGKGKFIILQYYGKGSRMLDKWAVIIKV